MDFEDHLLQDAAVDHDLGESLLDLPGDHVDLHRAPPEPPDAPGGGRPRSDRDHWLSRSPWWILPMLVSVVFGLERLAMLVTVPGAAELPVIIGGTLFVATFSVVLVAGGLLIQGQRR